jgi:hypothetical protein
VEKDANIQEFQRRADDIWCGQISATPIYILNQQVIPKKRMPLLTALKITRLFLVATVYTTKEATDLHIIEA